MVQNLFESFSSAISEPVKNGLEALLDADSAIPAHAREALVRRVATQHGCEELADLFATSEPALADLDDDALAYVDTVSVRPEEVTRTHVQGLLKRGHNADDVIILNQIAAITAVAARLIEGARAIDGEVDHPTVDLAQFRAVTAPQASWTPWLEPLSQQDLGADLIDTYGSKLNLPFLRVLARHPRILSARVGLDAQALLRREGLDRADREIAATVKSRVAGCDNCAVVHAGKAAHFLKDGALESQLLTEVAFGSHDERRTALIEFCAGLSVVPIRASTTSAQALSELGLSKDDLRDLVAATAYMAWPNRVTLGLGSTTPAAS